MMLAIEASSRCSVSEQSSTESITATCPGKARRTSEARATPAAPAMQPRPKMGVRFTRAGSPSRFMSRASSEGVDTPVTVTKKRWSTSPGSSPARRSASRTAASPTCAPAAR